MRSIVIVLAAAAACLPSVSLAVDHLEKVKSEVFEARGSPTELRARARACIERLDHHAELRTGDEERGELVTTVSVDYGLKSIVRSSMTFEARPDRFRITHANIARGNAADDEWEPVAMKWGSGWKRVERMLQAKSAAIASCVRSADPHRQAQR